MKSIKLIGVSLIVIWMVGITLVFHKVLEGLLLCHERIYILEKKEENFFFNTQIVKSKIDKMEKRYGDGTDKTGKRKTP